MLWDIIFISTNLTDCLVWILLNRCKLNYAVKPAQQKENRQTRKLWIWGRQLDIARKDIGWGRD